MKKEIYDIDRRTSIEESLAKDFHFRGEPAIHAFIAPSTPPMTFSRMRNEQFRPEEFVSLQPENAFVFQIPLVRSLNADIRYSNKQIIHKGTCEESSYAKVDTG